VMDDERDHGDEVIWIRGRKGRKRGGGEGRKEEREREK